MLNVRRRKQKCFLNTLLYTGERNFIRFLSVSRQKLVLKAEIMVLSEETGGRMFGYKFCHSDCGRWMDR